MEVNTGKIGHNFFDQFIQNKCGRLRQEVSVGPGFGVDVSIIDLHGGEAIAIASDPLSIIPSLGLKESAWLSVQLTANDIATTGFAPMYGQFVLNLDSKFSKKDFQVYWDYIHQFSSDMGMSITGGHTGFIEGQNSTIAGGGTFLTVAPKNQLLTSRLARPGNAILVTKSCAVSSSSILAMSFPKIVKEKAGTENYHMACESFYDISILKDALTAVDNHHGEVVAMHDVTEGGVLGAIYELTTASGNGAVVYNEKLPINEAQIAVCKVFSLDPRYCIGAGSMIITCEKESVQKIISRLRSENINCVEVGEITEKDKGIKLINNGKSIDMDHREKDPYWEAFYKAFNLGWK